MRLDFVQQRRKWEAEQAREASRLDGEMMEEDRVEEEYELPTATHAMFAPSSQPDEEVDEVLQREEAELAELLAYMPGLDQPADSMKAEPRRETHWNDTVDPNQDAWNDTHDASQNAWSDDDGYEALFSEFAAQGDFIVEATEQRHDTASYPSYHAGDAQLEEAMDLS